MEAALDAVRERADGSTDWRDLHGLGVTLFMAGHIESAAEAFDSARKHHPEADENDDTWMLSPEDADCRLALISPVIVDKAKE